MRIELKVTGTPVDTKVPGPKKPGYQFIFSDDLVVERVDNKVPGTGLPANESDRCAGTHSGSVTVLRDAAATDQYVPGGGELFGYEGTYRLKGVTDGGQTVLPEGQVTARGTVHLQNGAAVGGKKFAITGGTGPYATARGQAEQQDTPNLRILEIVL